MQLLGANGAKMYPKQLMKENFDGMTFQPSKRLKVEQILLVQNTKHDIVSTHYQCSITIRTPDREQGQTTNISSIKCTNYIGFIV